ncbi:unnamed protein product [Prunus armeniaca]
MGRAGFELGWRMRLDYAAGRYNWAEMRPDLVAGEYCRVLVKSRPSFELQS